MAIREQAPSTQRRERKHTPDAASIASRVAGVVDNLQSDRQALHNPFELRRRADMAMVAMLEVVAPVLPDLDAIPKVVVRHFGVHRIAL